MYVEHKDLYNWGDSGHLLHVLTLVEAARSYTSPDLRPAGNKQIKALLPVTGLNATF